MSVQLLIATVPNRRSMMESLLAQVTGQSLVSSVLHLALDGYGDIPSPNLPPLPVGFSVNEYRMPSTGGPGGRWRTLKHVPADVTLVVLDDDQCLDGPDVIETLVNTVALGGAASYMGMTADGCGGVLGAGTHLVSLAAGVSAYRASDLIGLSDTAAEVRERCGFDPFGELGDDDAVVALHLWRKGVVIRATGLLAVREAPGGQDGSQFVKRQAAAGREGRSMFWQRRAIAQEFGWPWKIG